MHGSKPFTKRRGSADCLASVELEPRSVPHLRDVDIK